MDSPLLPSPARPSGPVVVSRSGFRALGTGGALGAGVAVGAALCLIGALAAICSEPSHPEHVLGAFATDLSARTAHQKFNARRAAAAIDGTVIPAGQIFSFNRVLRGWSGDQGFLKAPVSYDGVLVNDYGGGVCQTSTTLYNAALLAGLPIIERCPHTFSPGYAPPGRDAAVAYSNVDLQFRNPYASPLTIRIGVQGHRLVCRIRGEETPPYRAVVSTRVLDWFPAPQVKVRPGTGPRSRWHPEGRPGIRVAVYRAFYEGSHEIRREMLSDNTYPAIARAEWDEKS